MLVSKSDGMEIEGEGSVKIKYILLVVIKKIVICWINGNLIVGMLEFDCRCSFFCKGNGFLVMMRLMKIGGMR